MPVALTIAGSDPGGGAGVQADLKTFAALGVYGYSALTSVIVQNSSTVERVVALKPSLVAAQIRIVVEEHKPVAIKTGALASAGIVRAVARAISALKLPAPVVDPVIAASAGARLLDRAGENAIRDALIPIARVVTPNLAEAELLARIEIDGDAALREAARRIVAMGARAVVVKGGHRASRSESTDLFFDGRSYLRLSAPRFGTGAHGTGCAFSSAIAAYLARGATLESAVRGAKRYLTWALRRSFRLGKGRPLLDHFARAR